MRSSEYTHGDFKPPQPTKVGPILTRYTALQVLDAKSRVICDVSEMAKQVGRLIWHKFTEDPGKAPCLHNWFQPVAAAGNEGWHFKDLPYTQASVPMDVHVLGYSHKYSKTCSHGTRHISHAVQQCRPAQDLGRWLTIKKLLVFRVGLGGYTLCSSSLPSRQMY